MIVLIQLLIFEFHFCLLKLKKGPHINGLLLQSNQNTSVYGVFFKPAWMKFIVIFDWSLDSISSSGLSLYYGLGSHVKNSFHNSEHFDKTPFLKRCFFFLRPLSKYLFWQFRGALFLELNIKSSHRESVSFHNNNFKYMYMYIFQQLIHHSKIIFDAKPFPNDL